jgi:hypothetical protein
VHLLENTPRRYDWVLKGLEAKGNPIPGPRRLPVSLQNAQRAASGVLLLLQPCCKN